jgi:hypothetical protein
VRPDDQALTAGDAFVWAGVLAAGLLPFGAVLLGRARHADVAATSARRSALGDAFASRRASVSRPVAVNAARTKRAASELRRALEALRPALAEAAQAVVDEWEQEEDECGVCVDEELGAGGCCDRVADALREVIAQHLPDVEVTDGGQPGDDHAWIVVYDDREAFAVDVPPGVYETGGGYSWKKVPDAKVAPEDVTIDAVPREWIEE